MPAARPGASRIIACDRRARWTSSRRLYRACRDRLNGYLGNPDPLAEIGNSGAFLVWSNQPFYPIYVAALVGMGNAWPSLLTWLSTPLFFSVPLVARRHPLGARVLFVVAGLANTLLSAKAFGPATEVAWFLVPCLIIALTFFRSAEWKIASALTILSAIAGLAVSHLGPPLHAFDAAQNTSLAHLNIWSVCALSAVLLFNAGRVRWRERRGV